MQSRKEIELQVDSITVTWCACERCASMGPRLITLIRNNREYVTGLRPGCCRPLSPAHCEDEMDHESFESPRR